MAETRQSFEWKKFMTKHCSMSEDAAKVLNQFRIDFLNPLLKILKLEIILRQMKLYKIFIFMVWILIIKKILICRYKYLKGGWRCRGAKIQCSSHYKSLILQNFITRTRYQWIWYVQIILLLHTHCICKF